MSKLINGMIAADPSFQKSLKPAHQDDANPAQKAAETDAEVAGKQLFYKAILFVLFYNSITIDPYIPNLYPVLR